ncbi:MAG TPA: DUF4097 family beta strand repeat-containing protein [Bacteroidales bacterium]|nr:DUF4097 family beta strand repeat-containing protein [Bacteroidales bacterium]
MLRRLSIFTLILNCFILSAQDDQLVIIPPAGQEERFLIFENPKGSVRVTGYDGDMIVVTGSPRYPEPEKKTASGLHRIERNPVDMRAEVNGRNVLLLSNSGGKTVDFDIKIPSWFSLKLKSLDNGNVDVLNVSGVIEVVNNNGNITLENITGAAVLSSVYGNISASFREVKPGAPMMFTSFEGDIVLTLPPTVNANLKMKTDKGEIYSGFDIQPVKRQPVVRQTENTSVYSLEDWTTGSINKGNGDFVLKTYSGNITLKKR